MGSNALVAPVRRALAPSRAASSFRLRAACSEARARAFAWLTGSGGGGEGGSGGASSLGASPSIVFDPQGIHGRGRSRALLSAASAAARRFRSTFSSDWATFSSPEPRFHLRKMTKDAVHRGAEVPPVTIASSVKAASRARGRRPPSRSSLALPRG